MASGVIGEMWENLHLNIFKWYNDARNKKNAKSAICSGPILGDSNVKEKVKSNCLKTYDKFS